jgi:hypothetical protein
LFLLVIAVFTDGFCQKDGKCISIPLISTDRTGCLPHKKGDELLSHSKSGPTLKSCCAGRASLLDHSDRCSAVSSFKQPLSVGVGGSYATERPRNPNGCSTRSGVDTIQWVILETHNVRYVRDPPRIVAPNKIGNFIFCGNRVSHQWCGSCRFPCRNADLLNFP